MKVQDKPRDIRNTEDRMTRKYHLTLEGGDTVWPLKVIVMVPP